MPEMTFENAADEVLLALTHGPTPGVQGWEIRESTVHGDKALAVLTINGQDFLVEISQLPEGE
jgi:hypothetical protein